MYADKIHIVIPQDKDAHSATENIKAMDNKTTIRERERATRIGTPKYAVSRGAISGKFCRNDCLTGLPHFWAMRKKYWKTSVR